MLDHIGGTPLLPIQRLGKKEAPQVSILVKAEWFNPGGSIKDRAARGMIQEALQSGKLSPKKTILDATSGNTGIALAMIGASLGYKTKLCIPANASMERQKILTAYGAELVLTDPMQGSDGAFNKVREIYSKDPDRYFYVDQYNNPANWKAHYDTTGVEIWKQSEKKVTHFVSGIGTSGTIIGTGKRLKDFNPNVRVIAMQPDSPYHGMEGTRHLESTMVPGIFDRSVLDETVIVSTEEAWHWCKLLSRKEGMLVGISSGANFAAAMQVAKKIGTGTVVTMFCDSGDRYLSDKMWETP